MTENTTNSSRRERRRQAQPLLARAVANNAGSFGRGVAIAAAASGMLASSAVAANAVPQDDQDAPAQRTESGAIPGQELTDYLPGTRGAIEQLAAQKGVGESLLFQQLVSDQDFVADNGELDHGAIADQVESQDADAEENSGSDQTLDDYLPGTRGVVEELAELEGQSPEAEFEALISNDAYVADNGELDHQALVSRVAELSGQNESAEQESEQEAPAEQEQAPAQPEQAPAEENSSQQSSASLDAYLPGTRGLVEELAQLEGTSASALFQELVNDSSYTDGGVLDHAALQSRVAELSGSNDDAGQQQAEVQAEVQAETDVEAEVNNDSAGVSAIASVGGDSSGDDTDSAPSPSTGSASGAVGAAYEGLGTPYVYGGKGPGGWDCSGFVAWAYAQAGHDIPSSTGAIQASGDLRWTDNPQPGDIVVQNGGGHVAIYVGNGQFIGAQNSSTGTLQYSYDSRPGNTHVGYLTLR
ncbi:hypothetical protein GCM10027060_21080 [Nesterenkonia halophila]|uniref:C40 family peptidase n=1 Tax=Nesterenkonia halophila TaxID=302044 RepID=UPI001FE99539|nr:C40 family peptidase [Nesterenkonia halophila]